MRVGGHRAADGLVDEPGVGGQRPALRLLLVAVLGQVVEQDALGHTSSHCKGGGGRQAGGRRGSERSASAA
jgi:hypothetical protein